MEVNVNRRFKRVLMEKQLSGEIVSVYANSEKPDKFSCGYVAGVDNEAVVIKHLNIVGRYDGYVVLRLDDIFRVECGGRYELKLKRLSELNHVKHEPIELQGTPVRIGLLRHAMNHRLVISAYIYEDDSELCGFVTELETDTVGMLLIDEYGDPEGNALIYLPAITDLACDTEHETALQLLFDNR